MFSASYEKSIRKSKANAMAMEGIISAYKLV